MSKKKSRKGKKKRGNKKRIPPTGICCICGDYGRLTPEHIPPQKAFNKIAVKAYSLEGWHDEGDKKPALISQGGYKVVTLCKACNNNTGSHYAREYVEWAKTFMFIVRDIESRPELFKGVEDIKVTLNNVYPLRFLKQAVVMMFSEVNDGNATFASNFPDLAEFVQNKEQTELNDAHRFHLRIQSSPQIRHWSIGAMGRFSIENGQLKLETSPPITEMVHPPFAVVMTHGESFKDATDITDMFRQYGYDEMVERFTFRVKIGRSVTPFPGEYRPL